MHKISTLIAAGLFALAEFAGAAVLKGVTLPDTAIVGGRELSLNGIGIREATIFNVKVYVSGLYLESKTTDPQVVINSKQLKRVEMHFVRAVGSGKIVSTWKEGFAKNCAQDCAAAQGAMDKLMAMTPDIKSGDVITFEFLPSGVGIMFGSKKLEPIANEAFGRALLAIWFGPHPPSEDLKNAMLGVH